MSPTQGLTSLCAVLALATIAPACAVASGEPVGTTAAALDQHPAFPQVPNQAGAILVSPRVITIIAANERALGTDDTPGNFEAFSAYLPQSKVWAAVAAEYGVGTLTAGLVWGGPALTGPVQRADIQSYVEGVVNAHFVSPSGRRFLDDGKTIYLVYIPPDATPTGDLGGSCGYHYSFPAGRGLDAIASVSRCAKQSNGKWVPSLNGGPETMLDAMTSVASHEVVEAATNPRGGGYVMSVRPGAVVPGVSPIWASFNGGGVELGDGCEGTRTLETSGDRTWELQRMWSNRAAAAGGDPCIPAASQAYGSVSVPQDWYYVHAGHTIEIPVTGWSNVTTASWYINRGDMYAPAGSVFDEADNPPNNGNYSTVDPLASTLGDGSASSSCPARVVMNDGISGTLTVTAPADGQTGDYMILRLSSFVEDDGCSQQLAEDSSHFWPVGIVIDNFPIRRGY